MSGYIIDALLWFIAMILLGWLNFALIILRLIRRLAVLRDYE